MRKIWLAGIGGAVAGVVVSTQFAAPIVAQEAEKEQSVYEQLDLFGDIFERIRTSYVEEVDEKELIESAINGMLTHLDPHSSYLPPDDFDDMRVQTKGEFGGLGIEVTQENGFVKVVSPIEGTPADRAGVQPGDFITQVDGESVMGLTLERGGRPDARAGRLGHHRHAASARAPRSRSTSRSPARPSPSRRCGRGSRTGWWCCGSPPSTSRPIPELEEALKRAGRGGRRHRQGDGLRHRPAQQPRRALNQAISVVDAFLEFGRDRLDPRPRPARQRALQRHAGRPDRRQAAGGGDQRRLGERVGDRRRAR